MRKNAKRILFYILFLSFAATASLVILYAYGWNFDVLHLRLRQAGGIFIKANPSAVNVEVNGKVYEHKPVIFNQGFLLSGLPAGLYAVKVLSEGYSSWQKEFAVLPGLVMAATKIMLFPLDAEAEFLRDGVDEFWLMNNGGILTKSGKTLVFTDSLGRNFKTKGVLPAVFDRARERFIARDDHSNYFMTDFTARGELVSLNASDIFYSLKEDALGLPGRVPIAKIFFHPSQKSKIVILTERASYILDSERNFIERLVLSVPDSLVSALSKNELVIAGATSTVAVYNFVSGEKEILHYPLSQNISSMEVSPESRKFSFVTEARELWTYDRFSKEWRFWGDKVRQAVFAGDGKQLAYLDEENEINVIFFEDYNWDFRKKAGEKITIKLPSTKRVKSLEWLTAGSDYLILDYGDELAVAETDYRSSLNSRVIVSGVKSFVQDKGGRAIYYLDLEKKLFRLTII